MIEMPLREPQCSAARRAGVALHGIVAVNALAGTWYAVSGAPSVPKSWLDGTPFDDYAVPGLILGAVVAGSQLGAAVALMRRTTCAKRISQAAGGGLLAWIGVQLALIGYRSPLQPAMVIAALGELGLASLGPDSHTPTFPASAGRSAMRSNRTNVRGRRRV